MPPNGSNLRKARLVTFGFCLIAVAGISIAVGSLSSLYPVIGRDPLIRAVWDMAGHGYWGVAIAQDLKSRDFPSLVSDTLGQKLWPFVHSYILSLFFIFLGDAVATASLASLCAFSLVCLLLFFLCREAGTARKDLGALAAVLLALTSPLYLQFSVLVMLEMFGALFTLAALWLYLRAGRLGSTPIFLCACLAATACFFTKYNYGLYLILTILLLEAGRLPASARAFVKRELKGAFRLKNLFDFTNLALAFSLVSLAVIICTGGVEFWIFGRRITMRSCQNPARILIAVVLFKHLRWMLLLRRRGRLSPRHRCLFFGIALPIALWLMVSETTDSFLEFAINRSSGITFFSLKNLLFYPAALLKDYCLSPVVFAALSGLYILSLSAWRRAPPGIKALHAYFLVTLGLMTFHPYKQSRFIFTVAPFWWLLASVEAMGLAEKFRIGKRLLAAAAVLLLVLAVPSVRELYAHRVPRAVLPWFRPEPDLSPVIENILAAAALPGPAAILGTFNELSPGLLRWNLARAGGEKNRSVLIDVPLGEIGRDVEHLGVKRVVCIRVAPGSPFDSQDWREYNGWKLETIRWVERRWKRNLRRITSFDYAGLTVAWYERR